MVRCSLLILVIGLGTLLGCQKDDPLVITDYCAFAEDYSTCTEIWKLSPEEYRANIVGTWIVRARGCEFCPVVGCQELPPGEQDRYELRTDGTFIYTDAQNSTSITTTYTIVDAFDNLIVEVEDTAFYFAGIRYRCGPIGVNDYRDFLADGGWTVYEKIE